MLLRAHRTILQSRPGNKGFPLNISASTQPTLQMSMARVYSLKVSMTSGARYHLDVTSNVTIQIVRALRTGSQRIRLRSCCYHRHQEVGEQTGRGQSHRAEKECVNRRKKRSESCVIRTLRSQLAFRSRFDGFKSRWRTSAE
jgi:hypothetical protein